MDAKGKAIIIAVTSAALWTVAVPPAPAQPSCPTSGWTVADSDLAALNNALQAVVAERIQAQKLWEQANNNKELGVPDDIKQSLKAHYELALQQETLLKEKMDETKRARATASVSGCLSTCGATFYQSDLGKRLPGAFPPVLCAP